MWLGSVKNMKTKQEHIDDVMDQFNFGKVVEVMLALDWRWVDANFGVPEEGELRKTARYLLSQVYDYTLNEGDGDDYFTIATGGFEASYYPKLDKLELKFVVASWDTGEF